MKTTTFVLVALLSFAAPASAQVHGCVNGVLADPAAYVFGDVLKRTIGQPAPDWEAVLQASGIPATSSVAGTVAGAEFYGITQWKGSSGNVRGRLSLPTAVPDSLGYLTRSADLLGDNPAWDVPCWRDSRACVWTWKEDAGAPAYAPRACGTGPVTQPPQTTPPQGDALAAKVKAIEDRIESMRNDLDALRAPQPVSVEELLKALGEAVRFECQVGRTGPGFLSHGHPCTVTAVKK